MKKVGRIHFHSETGTEGGYFAFQDFDSISHISPEWAVFKGSKVHDPDDVFRRGKVLEAYDAEGEHFTSAKKGDISYLNIDWEDGESEDELRRSDSVLVERWAYDGLVILVPGDSLVIHEKGIGSATLWAGEVVMERQDPYDENSYSVFGLASHYRPTHPDIEADEWSKFFMQERFATLLRK